MDDAVAMLATVPPCPADAGGSGAELIHTDCERHEAGAGAGATTPAEQRAPRPDAVDAPDAARIVEALLFASDVPLGAGKLAELSSAGSGRSVDEIVARLNEGYEAAGMSFRIERIAGGYQMMTLPAFRPWVSRLVHQRAEARLSDAALETLAVVAYKQPVIRADVEAIRGVACGDVLSRLRELGLVRIVGRAEVVGRPMLYGTTRRFLDLFGLASLDDLPPMEALIIRRPRAADEPRSDDLSSEASRAAAGA